MSLFSPISISPPCIMSMHMPLLSPHHFIRSPLSVLHSHKTVLLVSHSFLHLAFQNRELFCRSRFSMTHHSPPRRLGVHAKMSFSRTSPWSCLCYFLWHASHHTHATPAPSLSPTIWQAATTINMVPILPGLIHIYGTSTRWALSCNLRKVMMSSKVFNASLLARPACNPLFSRWGRMRAPRLCACGLEYCTNVLLTCLEVFLCVRIKKRLWLLLLIK